MESHVVSLKVLTAYAQDVGRGIIRMDRRAMDTLDVTNGDLVQIIGEKEGTDARCYQLLPSDQDQGIARIDPALRKIIGIIINNSVTVRKMEGNGISPQAQLIKGADEEEEARIQTAATTEELFNETIKSSIQDEAAPAAFPSTATRFALSGSCTDFEKERPKIMQFIATLESVTDSQSKCKCYSDGKKALGWDFFLLEMDGILLEKLVDIYPEVRKQEASSMEDRFALWLNKQLKKMTHTDYHLKLRDVSQETIKGFRLNPEHFRDETSLEDLR